MKNYSKTSIIIASVIALVLLAGLIYWMRAPVVSNVARGGTVTASSTFETHSPANAIDGDPGTIWNAGAFPPAWIEIDLGMPRAIEQIRLIVEQNPAGATVHSISFGTAAREFSVVEVLSQETVSGQELTLAPNSAQRDAQFVRVETTSSPSWVAWKEIEIWAPAP